MKQTKLDTTLSINDTEILYIHLYKYVEFLKDGFFDIPQEDIYRKNKSIEIIQSLNFLHDFIKFEKSTFYDKQKYVLRFKRDIDKPIDIQVDACLLLPYIYAEYINKALNEEIQNQSHHYFSGTVDSPNPEEYIETRKKLEIKIKKLMRINMIFAITNKLPGLVINEGETRSIYGF